ncbi:MAG TPA: hypothetical protein VFP72_03910 [Kineosporiaceae bacterium]|nr:hypothetical protein [Kineosporiaceae bacterium]
MASSAGPRRSETQLLFRAVFADWHARAGVLSALPDAPVVPDGPRRRFPAFWPAARGWASMWGGRSGDATGCSCSVLDARSGSG